jgi:type II secretory pathway pseudopilin PulG
VRHTTDRGCRTNDGQRRRRDQTMRSSITDPRSSSRAARRRGVGLVELLVSLAITAALLVAVAGAFTAAAAAVDANDQFFRSTQVARVCINQIITEVRRCQSGTVHPDGLSMDMQLNTGENRTYIYDPTTKTLQMVLKSIPVMETHTMAHNVESMSFASNGPSVSITMRVKTGNNEIVLNGSGMVRRLVTY